MDIIALRMEIRFAKIETVLDHEDESSDGDEDMTMYSANFDRMTRQICELRHWVRVNTFEDIRYMDDVEVAGAPLFICIDFLDGRYERGRY